MAFKISVYYFSLFLVTANSNINIISLTLSEQLLPSKFISVYSLFFLAFIVLEAATRRCPECLEIY